MWDRVRRAIALILSFALVQAPLPSLAAGQTLEEPKIVVGSQPETMADEPSSLVFGVQSLEPGTEGQVLESLTHENPEAIVTVIGKQNSTILNRSLPRVHSYAIDEQALIQEAKGKLREMGEPVSGLKKLAQTGKGILLTIGTAANFVGAYSFFNHDLIIEKTYILFQGDLTFTAKMFATALAVNGFQILFTSYWQKYLRTGGDWMKRFWGMAGKVFGESIANGRVAEDIGRILAAYGFNLAAAATIMGFQTAREQAIWLLILGAMSSWDAIWDLALDRQIEKGTLKNRHLQRFIPYRLWLGPPTEAMAWTGSAAAMIVMALIGSGGLLTFLMSETARRYISRLTSQDGGRQKPMWRKSVKQWVSQARKNSRCAAILRSQRSAEF